MNKIYKVVWSKVKNCYVVASELAKRRTKGSGARGLHRAAVSLGIVAALLGGFSGSAWADGSGTIAANATGVITAGDNITISASTVSGSGYDAPITTITISAIDTTYTAGNGLQLTGTEFSVKNADSTISVDASGIKVNVGSVDENNTGLVTGGAVYTALSAKADSATTYTKTEVDTALGTKADKDGSNVTTPATWANKLGTGTVGGNNDALLVTGATVSTAVTNGSLALSGTTLNATSTGASAISAASGNFKVDGSSGKVTSVGLDAGTGDIETTGAVKGGTATITGLATVGSLKVGSVDVSSALSTVGVIASGDTGAGLVKGSTVYDYLNGAKLALGAESTQIEIGKDSSASGADSIAIGSGDSTQSESGAVASAANAIAIGNSAKATKDNAIAVGYNAQAIEQSETTALGAAAYADKIYATAVGSGAEAKHFYSTALGAISQATGQYSIAVGANAQASGLNSVAIGGGLQTGNSSDLAAMANGPYSIAIGNSTSISATGDKNTAIGYNNTISDITGESPESLVKSTNLNVFGQNNKITGSSDSIFIGNRIYTDNGADGAPVSNANHDVFLGNNINVGSNVEYSIGIGDETNVTGRQAIAIGYQSLIGPASSSGIAIGNNAKAYRQNAIALGTNTESGSWSVGDDAIAIGNTAKAKQNSAIAIGKSAEAGNADNKGLYSTALGANANANDNFATAIGSSAHADYSNATAFGYDAYANSHNTTALGSSTDATGQYAVAIGQYAKTNGTYAIAIGGGNRSESSVEAATAIGEGSIAIGKSASTTAEQATAVGMNTNAVANGTAIGYNALANKNASTAIGYGANATGNGENATAIGYSSSATGHTSIAIAGTASASLAIAIGRSTTATGERAIGIGVETTASGVKSIAIGSNSSASLDDSVALGSGAVTTRAAYATTNYNAYLNEDGSKTPDAADTATKNTWRATHGAVAVGNDATVTRQITGVAAGSADTDAVNVAQLKSATPMINDEHKYYDGSSTAVKVTDAVNAVDAGLGAKITANGNYIKASSTNTINANIQALDTAIGSMSEFASNNYAKSTTSVAANLKSLDTQVKTNMDNIATLESSTSAAIGTLTDDGNYILKTNNVSQNLSVLDTQMKINATNIGTLQTKTQNISATDGTTTMNGVLNVSDPTSGTTGVAISGSAKTITAGGVAIDGANNTLKVGGDSGIILSNSTSGSTVTNTLKVGGVTISDNGTAKTITGLSNTTWDASAITSGQAATEDQLKSAITSISGSLTDTGLKFTANCGGSFTNKLGSTVSVKGSDAQAGHTYSESNVTTAIEQDTTTGNSTITVKLDENPSFTSVTASGNISGADIVATGKVQGASLTDGTAKLQGGALSDVTNLTATGNVTLGSGENTVTISGGAVTATGNISGKDISASGMLSSATLKVGGVDVTTPLTTVGKVESSNAGFVTGGTVYSEVRPADGNYVKKANTTAANLTALDSAIGSVAADGNYIKASATSNVAQNLTALDTQVKTNADNIAALQSSTTASVGTIDADGNYIKKSDTNNVSQNLIALDTQTKTNADNIAANKAAIGTTADGSYVKAAETVGRNLNALDTQVKTNTDDIATLKNSISVQEDASGTKTTTIDGNLVIKEDDGTTKDVTAALTTEGEVAKQGEAGSEGYLKGETVYDYLNKGENGKEVKLAKESKQIAVGQGSVASGVESIAIGNETGGQRNEATGLQSIAIGFGNQVTGAHSGAFGDPNTVTGTGSYVLGNNNNISGNDSFVVGNNATATGNRSVVLGEGSTDDGATNVVSVGATGNERQIKHVAPGTDANDAATVGQVAALAQNTTTVINQVDSKLNKVGAGAAALAALHPIDTDDKFTMGIGYGNYRSAHSAAIGLFYRPTDKIMLSVGGAMGNGENMINAGISFALDKGKGFGTSKAAMARKIASQDEEIKSLKEENAKLEARLAAIEAKLGK